jgi:hypothetical protein
VKEMARVLGESRTTLAARHTWPHHPEVSLYQLVETVPVMTLNPLWHTEGKNAIREAGL